MKRTLTSLLLGVMILGGSMTTLADTCSLDEEAYQEVTSIKDQFIDELLDEGDILEEEADFIAENFIKQSGQDHLMALGFTDWLKKHNYTDTLL